MAATRNARAASPTATIITLAALYFAAVDAAVLAISLKAGIGLLIALLYAPLVLLALPVGIALYVPLIFIAHLSAVSVAPNAAGILIVLAWLGTLRVRRRAMADVLHRHRRLIAAMLVLLVWLALTLAWAPKPGKGGGNLLGWGVAVLLFVIIATTFARSRDIRMLLVAFVVGAALSVAIGLVNGGLTPGQGAANAAGATATETEGRLQGGGGDPNYLATALVAALVIAAGLAATTRKPMERWALALAGLLIIIGFAATQSRGGLLGAAVAVVAAFVVFKRQRAYVALLVACVLSVGGAWFASHPDAWHRVTHIDGGGNGRSDEWRLAWRITQDHPIIGVGLNNFRVYAPQYVRRPGALQYTTLIIDRPHVVHNTYLQLLVETGVIGAGLFLAVVLGCLRVLWLAAKRFEQIGNDRMSTISRSVLVAALGALASSFFISNGGDQRIWLLFGLGPPLLALACRGERKGAMQ